MFGAQELLDGIATLPADAQAMALDALQGVVHFRDEEKRYNWHLHARQAQLPPWDKRHLCSGCAGVDDEKKLAELAMPRIWLMHPGRRWGKNRAASEAIRHSIEYLGVTNIGIVGPTAADVRKKMVGDDKNVDSGLLQCFPPSWGTIYNKSSKRISIAKFGASIEIYSAEKWGEGLRGAGHQIVWCDEPDSWSYRSAKSSPEGALLCWNEVGMVTCFEPAIIIVTATPKPGRIVNKILKDMESGGRVHETTGSTYDNQENLSEIYMKEQVVPLEGTNTGEQEVWGRLLKDVPGAAWSRMLIEECRCRCKIIDDRQVWFYPKNGEWRAVPEFNRVAIGLDPNVSKDQEGDEAGIVLAASSGIGPDADYFIVGDFSGAMSDDQWCEVSTALYRTRFADTIVGEKNVGGSLVEKALRTYDENIHFVEVHAHGGKIDRAREAAILSRQKRLFFMGVFPKLEDEMTGYIEGRGLPSPNRMDSAVHVIRHLSGMSSGGWEMSSAVLQ